MSGLRRLWAQDWTGLALVVAAAIVALALVRPAFLSALNIYVVLIGFSLSLLVSLSQMVIIAIGQMNLSVGAIGGLVAIAFAGMMEVWGLPWPLAFVAGLAIGVVCGFVNGFVTVLTGISAFVITLATLSIYKGINLGITKAQPFYGVPQVVKDLGNESFLGGAVPYLLVPPVLIALAMGLLMRRTVFGRQMLAVGGNAHAAELSGIDLRRTVVGAHVLSGVLAALAGMLAVARIQIGQPTIGDGWLIVSFAAPVLGGAVLTGGHVSVAGTCLGVLLVTLITNALVLLEVDPFLVQLLLGLMILGAVWLNRYRDVRARRAPAVP
ncbi:MAG: ABC transporter permease [Alphaproteobacteria bacterium]